MELGDRELPGRHVVEQLEQNRQRVVVRVVRNGQQEDLRVEVVQRALDLGRLGDANHALEAEGVRLVPHREVGLDDHGFRRRSLGVEHPPEVQERKRRRDAHRVRVRKSCERVRALRLGGTGAGRVRDLDDERDAVALGDRLTQLAHETGS